MAEEALFCRAASLAKKLRVSMRKPKLENSHPFSVRLKDENFREFCGFQAIFEDRRAQPLDGRSGRVLTRGLIVCKAKIDL